MLASPSCVHIQSCSNTHTRTHNWAFTVAHTYTQLGVYCYTHVHTTGRLLLHTRTHNWAFTVAHTYTQLGIYCCTHIHTTGRLLLHKRTHNWAFTVAHTYTQLGIYCCTHVHTTGRLLLHTRTHNWAFTVAHTHKLSITSCYSTLSKLGAHFQECMMIKIAWRYIYICRKIFPFTVFQITIKLEQT